MQHLTFKNINCELVVLLHISFVCFPDHANHYLIILKMFLIVIIYWIIISWTQEDVSLLFDNCLT